MKQIYPFKCLLLSIIAFLSALNLSAQIKKQRKTINAGMGNTRAYTQNTTGKRADSTFFVRLESKDKLRSTTSILKEKLHLSANDNMLLKKTNADNLGYTHETYEQQYKGIKVEYGITKVHKKANAIETINGEYYQIPSSLTVVPALAEAAALQQALNTIKAKTYKWQDAGSEKFIKAQTKDPNATYYPNGELVICKITEETETGSFALTYKFNIYATAPLSRFYIYVDAHSGKIVHRNSIIKTDVGTAATHYSGSRQINTRYINNSYRLHDNTRGNGIETYKLNANNNLNYITDADNNWTAAEFNNAAHDDAALDAHWGAMMAYDYLKNIHGRNSYDDLGTALISLTNYGNATVENAYWDGTYMVYGGGSNPFTALDICGHEIGHAITEHTSNLFYEFESGALNEGFSDIWGACVEHYADPSKQTWLIGEDIYQGSFIRSMSNPNAGYQPDTYMGTNWYIGSEDFGGVHTNSGVLNYWFYLLSTGGTGTNDFNFPYNVTAITMDKAAKIAYQAQDYLSTNSGFYDARLATVQAAEVLYGSNSNEVIQTKNAWDAVGVYDNPTAAPTNLISSVAGMQVNLNWTDNAGNETGYSIERSTTPGFNYTVIAANLAPNTTAYADNSVSNNVIYYYRVQALNTTVLINSSYSNELTVQTGNAPVIVMSNTPQTTCNAIFMDSGKFNPYSDNEDIIQTFTPGTPGSKVSVSFSAFDVDNGYDYLYVYDGANTNAPLIGSFTGNTIPPVFYASQSNTTGQLTFRFVSDYYSTASSGWQAAVSCVTLPNAPSNLTAAPALGTQSDLTWTDNSSDETGFIIERSVDIGKTFSPIATVTPNSTSYSDSGLPTNVTYQYRIKAINGVYQSNYSNIAVDILGYLPFTDTDAGILPLGNSPMAWGDYDNDGDLDILIAGNTLLGNTPGGLIVTKIYNNNNGVFTDINAGLPGVTKGSVSWGDYDNDGDLDILLNDSP